MKKQELIQTHQLLALVRKDAEERNLLEETPSYDEIGVGANAIHRSKDDHEDAILALAEDLADSFEAAEMEQSEPEEPLVS